jgi:hypothetical protein
MFWADNSTAAAAVDALGAALPPGSADAELAGEAVALAAADGATDGATDDATEPDGAADPLASAEGIGVADAGAYVQPGVDVVQAVTAAMVRPATSRRIGRMGSRDLEMVAEGRGRHVLGESTASGRCRRVEAATLAAALGTVRPSQDRGVRRSGLPRDPPKG